MFPQELYFLHRIQTPLSGTEDGGKECRENSGKSGRVSFDHRLTCEWRQGRQGREPLNRPPGLLA